jgi:dolichol-phosphate mannosyltransferase
MSLLLNFAFRTAFALKCRDVTNSLRLYRGAVLRSITLQSDDFDILQEILIKIAARRPRAEIVEIPMTFLRRSAGKSKRQLVPFIIAYLRTMARLWRFRRTT